MVSRSVSVWPARIPLISNETGRLLVLIVPETDVQADPISYDPSLAKEIETEYGKSALEGLQNVGFKFEEPALS